MAIFLGSLFNTRYFFQVLGAVLTSKFPFIVIIFSVGPLRDENELFCHENHPLKSQEESTRTEDPHAILGDDGELFSLGLCYIYTG